MNERCETCGHADSDIFTPEVITRRDHFAAAALSGLSPLPWSWTADGEEKAQKYVEDTARTAFQIADAMLKEGAK